MRVYQDFYLLPGSGSTFPEVDPDPAKWYRFERIRIRNKHCNDNGISCLVVRYDHFKINNW